MPANNVTLIGYFMADRNTPYKIEHYRETFNDNEFELFETETDKFGETNTTATAQPKVYEGFTFDPSRNTDLSGTIVADNPSTPEDETLVLKVYYTRNDVTVTYEFDGDVPSGITEPAPVTKKYGESYTIREAMNVPGYDFTGWYYTSDLTYTDVSGDTIVVDRDIYLAGEFTAKTDTVYTVEHWIQNTNDDNYTKEDRFTQTLKGTTDTDVTAYARTITGVSFNATETNDNLDSGQRMDTTGSIPSITANIDRNGNTVIKFYYDRIEYTVTYRFEGTVPAGAPNTDALKQENVRYGKTVIVDTTVPNGQMPVGYEDFFGWYRGAALESNLVDEFTMPARDVELLGYFVPDDDTVYTVRHFLQNADDDDYTEDTSRRETFRGETLQNVTANPLLTVLGLGYTYNDTASTDSGQILADGSLELLLYYDRIEYPVTYMYIDAPAGADSSLTGFDGNYRHGKEVEYKQVPTAVAGYTFHGWRVQDGDIETTTDGFIMPNRAVTVYGMWTPNSNTRYKVEHYYEGLNGIYGDGEGAATPKFTETQHTGTTGHTATAAEIPQVGFTLNLSYPETLRTDEIRGDGSTTLKLYYTRNLYDVSYVYSGAMPDNDFKTTADGLLPNDNGNPFRVKYGAEYEIEVVINPALYPDLAGYTFHGWTPNDTALVVTDNKFIMPAHNVELVGHFHADTDTPYKIEHYLELPGGGYPSTAQYSENRPGETDTYATVYARKFEGFTFDQVTTVGFAHDPDSDYYTITKQISGDGTTVFKFYYNRNKNTVTYEFDGVQPHGISLAEHEATMASYNQSDVYYGTTVAVKNDLEQAGYDFTGWYSEDPAIAESDASFTMPDKPVVLKGRFTARDDTQYKVQYHLQKLNAEETGIAGTNKMTDYELQDADTVIATGTTGHNVTAEIKHYDGFAAITENVITTTVAGDGTTVIDIYYDRVTNPISYHFYGAAPEHTDADLPAIENNVPYGAKRQVAPELVCDPSHRHEFTGWGSPHVTPVEGEFTMPATRVQFFTAARNKYSVIYDLDGGTGAEGVAYTPFDVLAGTVIDVKPAPVKASHTFIGWKLDGTENIYNPDDEITVNQDIKLIAQYSYNGGGGVPGGGGGSTRYTLTYNTNGGSDIPNETHTSGNTVKLTKEPEKEGYIFDGWHLDTELTEDVTEVKMTKHITVYAAWVEDNGNAGNGHPTPGALNGEEHFAYVIGYPDGTVRPDDNITRAEVTSIFFRLLKEEIREANLTQASSYGDVVSGDWFNTAIATMTKLGIVKGRYEGKFVPDASITRAEFAVICARFDDSEFEIKDDFADVDGHWAESEIHEAAAHGWIRGYEDNTFKPDQYITRAEAMTMINRVLNRIPEKASDLLPDMIKWADNSNTNEWYYIAIQEATNSHEYEMKNSIYEVWTKLTWVEDWAAYAK